MAVRRHVVVDRGPNCGERFFLDTGRHSIGRGRTCSVRLDDAGCSREHCAIEVADEAAVVVDLGSKNGTSLNGIPVDRRALASGDRIVLGETVLVYLEDAEEESTGRIDLDPSARSRQTLTLRLGEGDDPWIAGAIGAVHAVSELGPRIAGVDDYLEAVLTLCLARTPATDGAIGLLGPDRNRLGLQIAARPGDAFQLAADVRDAVLGRAEAVLVENPEADRTLGVPIWIGRRVGGILCLSLPPEGNVGEEFLHLMAILGSLVGATIQSLERLRTLEREKRVLSSDLQSRFDMVGQSEAMKKVYDLIERIAPTETTVLIGGESGTGKELVARAIHYRSPRAGGPLVTLNAAAIPIDLVESELFGHEKGAFTGADRRKKGRFELADGGTLFLDEIGDLDERIQARFLRVLEDGTFHRVGGTEMVATDVRLIAATHHDLAARVRAGTFREDLYYRLRVVEMRLPPLRERKADIPLLVRHFMAHLSAEMGKRLLGPTDEAMELLAAHDWPGNVRELKNTIERAMVLTTAGQIDATHLEFLADERAPDPGLPAEDLPTLDQVETEHILRVLERVGGNKTQAARILGIDRTTLYLKLKRLERA